MSDWIGLLFFTLLIVGAFVGLKVLSKPHKRTTEEFERCAAEGGSMLGATVNALQEAIDPARQKPQKFKYR